MTKREMQMHRNAAWILVAKNAITAAVERMRLPTSFGTVFNGPVGAIDITETMAFDNQ